MKKNSSMLSLGVLIKRNIKLFMKDKIIVFFSVLAPILVLLIYILFLGKLEVGMVENFLSENGLEGALTRAEIQGVINNWMIAGVMGISCISVAINANLIMVKDRANGSINDVLASPVKKIVLYLSYIISSFLITCIITMFVLVFALIYLACTGGFMLSFGQVCGLFGLTILATMGSSLMISFLCSFIKSPSQLTAANSVFSAAIGFFIGAYMPFSMLPDFVQHVGCFIPGTYSAGLYKHIFLSGVFERLSGKLPANVVSGLMDQYSIELDFFGTKISAGWMAVALIASIVLFLGLIFIFYSNKRTNFFAITKKKKRKKV